MKTIAALGIETAKPHDAIRQVAPLHPFQTEDQAGIGMGVIPTILEELRQDMPAAIDRTNANLPAGFPGKIAGSISNGIRRRLGILDIGNQEEATEA